MLPTNSDPEIACMSESMINRSSSLSVVLSFPPSLSHATAHLIPKQYCTRRLRRNRIQYQTQALLLIVAIV